jgi:hypothetical protein
MLPSIASRVLLGHEQLPFDDADRHVHFRQRHVDVALLENGVPACT